MKICALIPCYNHGDTLKEVLSGLPLDMPAIVVDDGSEPKIEIERGYLLRLEKNSGKAEALKAGFEKARSLGFTHAISLDADCQHDPKFLEAFQALAEKKPEALIAGVRDFKHPLIPKKRRFLNNFSNFWFKFETGMALNDTQCGYRCYPLGLVDRLKLSCPRYAYEAEILVKTIWAGGEIIPLEVSTIYTSVSTQNSHYRAFRDTLIMSAMNTKLSFMALFFPKSLRKKLSVKGENA